MAGTATDEFQRAEALLRLVSFLLYMVEFLWFLKGGWDTMGKYKIAAVTAAINLRATQGKPASSHHAQRKED